MWFEPHTSNLVGGLLGSFLGVCGGVWGISAGVFARKGKHKKAVLTFAVMLIILGAVSLCTGIAALIARQPYHVWYPFVLIGIVLTAVLTPNYLNVRKMYTRAELHRMAADNLG